MNQVQNNLNKEDNSQQNNTGNMYSYQDDNNINNQNELEAGAIRRSLGQGNPNANYSQPYYNPEYNQNPNDMNINGGNVEIGQSQTYNNNFNNSNNSNNSFIEWVPYIIFGCFEILMIILIACLYNWDIRNDPKYYNILNSTDNDIEIETNFTKLNFNETIYKATEEELNIYDGIFRDINIMAFVGFGMFHTLLKRYSWTSITINMMGIAFSFQIGLFTNLLWENAFKENWKKGVLNFQTFIKSIISSCSIIISLGCVLGKLSSTQYIILIIIETIMSSLNFQLCDAKLKVIDVGGSLYIHTFGAIFGIAIYMVLFCSQKMKSQVLSQNYFNKSNYFSNITSFIGVMFLICYFPSFNTALALDNGARYRASINTYFSIAGSIIGSFITSALFNKGKIFFEHILFGCFSGGVIISGCCSVCLDHWAALLIGFLCGGIIVTLLSLLKPYFMQWQFYDIYNIIIIHCIPGILGAFITSMMIGDIKRRKDDYYLILLNDMERENNIQAGIQVGAIFITIGLSFISGIATGYLMKISTCGKVIHFFTDSELFENDKNIIDNLEQNQFYSGPINRASLFQNKIDFPPSRASDIRASHPSYN